MRRRFSYILLFIGICVFFITLWTKDIIEESQKERLYAEIVTSSGYREQNIGEEMLAYLRKCANPGESVALFLLESKYGYNTWNYDWTPDTFQMLKQKWKEHPSWGSYCETSCAIWNDVMYFPVPESTSEVELEVSYVDSWMLERTYGGKRGHEGTDVMAKKNQRGLYPILSMTDGVVVNKGWLEKGGYRIGIESPSGAYFYYAHLDSYARLQEGDVVKAGDVLGFMGDSGYGPEGTTGKFPVHLHLGIYIYPNGEEVSVNPYWVLRYIENRKVKCYTEK